MRFPQRTILTAGLMLAGSMLAPAAYAEIFHCNDTDLDYSTICPSTATGGRCINPLDNENGCCNKGTCTSGGICVTGADPDALCLNDGNDCVNQTCHQDANHQAVCVPSNAPSTQDCNLDSDVCTLDKCDGNGSCAATGNINTCAAEQQQNPAEQPICKPWKCNSQTGCAKTGVLNDPIVACDDGKDCTTGDHCINAVCGKGSSGTVLQHDEPCRADDTSLGNGDSRTWCRAGVCHNDGEDCDLTNTLDAGAACDPNPCTNATCATRGGNCVINSCNTGQTVSCEPCGQTLNCVNYGAGQSANLVNACGCLSLF